MLPTLSVEKVKMLHQNKTIEIRGAHINDFKDYIPNDSKPKLKYAVTELMDRQPGDLLDALANGIEQEPIWEPGTPLRLKEELQSNVEGGNMELSSFFARNQCSALFICKNDWKRFTELFLPYCLKIFYFLKPEWQAKFTKIRDKANDDRRSWQESESFHEDLTFLALIFAQNQERLATRVHQVNFQIWQASFQKKKWQWLWVALKICRLNAMLPVSILSMQWKQMRKGMTSCLT